MEDSRVIPIDAVYTHPNNGGLQVWSTRPPNSDLIIVPRKHTAAWEAAIAMMASQKRYMDSRMVQYSGLNTGHWRELKRIAKGGL